MKQKDNAFDVIIIGGGPAGTTSAYLLNKYGYKVLLLDKKEFPRSKLCGGLITEKTLNLMLKIFDLSLSDLFNDNVIDYVSDSYKVYFKDKLITENKMETKFYLVRREVYDHYLLTQVKNNKVKVIEDTKVVDIDFENNKVITENNDYYQSKYIIAADGANSLVRNKIFKKRRLRNSKKIKKNIAISIETEIKRTELSEKIDQPILYFGILNWGYGWVFPKKDTVTIGIAGLKNRNRDYKEIFKDYLKIIDSDIKDIKIKGWPIPFGNYLKKPVYKNTFLVGDAANFTDPLTGEGLYYAHKSAKIATYVIHKSKKEVINLEREYSKNINNLINKKLKKAKLYRNILWSPPLFIQKILISFGSRFLNKKITNMIQGEQDYEIEQKEI